MVTLTGKKLLGTVILNLLIIGSLGYLSLPQAYCPLENTTQRYIHISDSRKTITKVIPEGESWKILDDRCQKGLQIGEWIPLNLELLDQCPECPWCPVECPACECPECSVSPECPDCPEEPNYYCESKDIKKYCFEVRDYGDKEDFRCLYDEDNLRAYYSCEEGWEEISGICPPCVQTCDGCGGGGCSSDPCDSCCGSCPPCIDCDEVNVLAYIPDEYCAITQKWFCDGVGVGANCIQDETLAMPFG